MTIPLWLDGELANRLVEAHTVWQKRFGTNRRKANQHWKYLLQASVTLLEERDRPFRALFDELLLRIQGEFDSQLTALVVATFGTAATSDERIPHMVFSIDKLLVRDVFRESPNLRETQIRGESWEPWLVKRARSLIDRILNAGPLFGNYEWLKAAGDAWETMRVELELVLPAKNYGASEIYDARERLAQTRVADFDWLRNAVKGWSGPIKRKFGLPNPPAEYSDRQLHDAQKLLIEGIPVGRRWRERNPEDKKEFPPKPRLPETVIELLVPWPEPVQIILDGIMDKNVSGDLHRKAAQAVHSEVEGRRRRCPIRCSDHDWKDLKTEGFSQLLVNMGWRIIKMAREWYESREPGIIFWTPKVMGNLAEDAEHAVKTCLLIRANSPQRAPDAAGDEQHVNQEDRKDVKFNSAIMDSLADSDSGPMTCVEKSPMEDTEAQQKLESERIQLLTEIDNLAEPFRTVILQNIGYDPGSLAPRAAMTPKEIAEQLPTELLREITGSTAPLTIEEKVKRVKEAIKRGTCELLKRLRKRA